MSLEKALKKYKAYLTERIEMYGATPKGVDFNSFEAQEIRLEQLVKIVNPVTAFSIIDYGCGYGALCDFLEKKKWPYSYHGFDLIEKMVIIGREQHKEIACAHFYNSEGDLELADYVVAGSIFNNKFDADTVEWLIMIQETLQRMNRLCTKGFAFNMLTSYSDQDRMAQRPDLYFGDPLFFFDYCKRNFSRNVTLLHDYDLYDFTILVRKNIG